MAIVTIKRAFELEESFVLAPERYDPRRESLKSNGRHANAMTVGDIAETVRHTINPSAKTAGDRRCLVLDTSDVREGIIIGRKKPIRVVDLGSQKKGFNSGDVIISRLRPYLRQVAFVDRQFAASSLGAELACSTEFFVLRSLTQEPIAFLVPYLLSDPVQKVLAASQEGGHHPRFDEGALLKLPIPAELFARRAAASASVEQSTASYRQAEEIMLRLVAEADVTMTQQRKEPLRPRSRA
jgi:hypothetical protein